LAQAASEGHSGSGWAHGRSLGPQICSSMDGQDGGAFAAAPPPVGLGNFKGVMLCNRPADDPSSKADRTSDEVAPFRSMIAASHGEQIGLTPCKTYEPTVKKRGSSAALRRHVRWLKELQGQMKEERDQVEQEDANDEDRKHKMKAVFDQHREAVRGMMDTRAKDWVDPARDPEKHKKMCEERVRKQTEKSKSKPLWAMTQQEKESFEDEEADSLINFAEGLDYDKYVGDFEFKGALEALKDRAGRLAKVSDSFKDDLVRDFNAMVGDDLEERSTSAGGSAFDMEDGIEGASLLGDLRSEGGRRRRSAEERSNADGRPEWDTSTQCDEDDKRFDRELKDTAAMVLESAPQIRAIHSKESMQRIIERARDKAAERPPANLIEAMEREGAAPAPVIVASSDTQNRLHKPVDPSLLPYLYRSPAV